MRRVQLAAQRSKRCFTTKSATVEKTVSARIDNHDKSALASGFSTSLD
jgi:hypothetical protein